MKLLLATALLLCYTCSSTQAAAIAPQEEEDEWRFRIQEGPAAEGGMYIAPGPGIPPWYKEIKLQFGWPDGRYSLPMSKSGCPAPGYHGTQWHEGWRYQDTEDKNNKNDFSPNHHLAGRFGEDIETRWCTKTSDTNVGMSLWPKGSYCIGRKSYIEAKSAHNKCPQGFQEGSIFWDDENKGNENAYGGVLPDGLYKYDTGILYCCRDDAHPFNPITLPTDGPFYLMRKHKDGCQQVKNMNVRSEWVQWDDENEGNTDREGGSYPYRGGSSDYDHKLHYCYYYP